MGGGLPDDSEEDMEVNVVEEAVQVAQVKAFWWAYVSYVGHASQLMHPN